MAEDTNKKKASSKNGKTAEKSAPVKRKVKKNVSEALVYVNATFNNTIITITDPEGNVLSSSSPGLVGFKGSKKSTAFGATKAAEDAAYKAQKYGVREAKVYIKGPGSGRNAAVKGIDSAGIRITLLSDITPLPHNGCRPRKQPRK
ncbi:MAG: 30S ribosomal protein S11 [Candidatus Dojkabacteria bacterium]|nr:30S ribosomal protein S11 [Candidatus Dojkabacteria bacterium]